MLAGARMPIETRIGSSGHIMSTVNVVSAGKMSNHVKGNAQKSRHIQLKEEEWSSR